MNLRKVYSWLTLAVFSATLVPGLALAKPAKHDFQVPPTASDDEDEVSLGSAYDPGSKQIVQGYAFIHYKKGFARKPGSNGGAAKTNTCYSYLAVGAKWKNVENWVVNPTNSRGLDSNFVLTNIGADIAKWEDASDGVMGNSSAVNILGDGSSTTSPLTSETTSPDNQNEVYFADISSTGVIAVTTVWGIFGGPTYQRRLVEWDMVIDDVDFDWSSTGAAGKMDFENIITHELGHAVGMGHPSDSCVNETMYRFADYGETKKSSLNAGDIAGINLLY